MKGEIFKEEVVPVKDQRLLDKMDTIVGHFRQNIYNQFLRKAFMVMNLQKRVWDILDNMDEKAAFRKSQGYEYEELYDIVIAAATFIHNAKTDVKPRLKSLLEGSQFSGFDRTSHSSNDRVLREMAISNFNSNLSIFSDQINELYLHTLSLDKEENKNCIYKKIPELKNIGQLLID